MVQRNQESGRQAVVWLATVFVIVIGAVASGFVVVVSAEGDRWPLIIWGGCFSGLLLLLFLFNLRWDEPIRQLKLWLSSQTQNDPVDHYSVAKRRMEAREKYGTNKPPSVESVREAQQDARRWVPRSSSTDRPPKSR